MLSWEYKRKIFDLRQDNDSLHKIISVKISEKSI